MATTDSSSKIDFRAIEEKWQQRWEESDLFRAPDDLDPANKFYMLVMFIYPSGDIHIGHFRNYIIGDAVARRQMMMGKNVLHPFGWDAFGLPAERAAIQRHIHPQQWTMQNIEISRRTLRRLGISFDWSREVTSCLPDYYRWTQWIFIQLFKKGLAYRQRGFVNWCPEDKTVLANEQVVNGKCERCGTEVVKKDQVQWYFKITEYADQLVDDLDKLPDWPDNVKTIQKEWIGRSHGAEIDFTIEDSGEKLPIFTTRPDTIYGVTFMAIAPEAELIGRLNLEEPYASQVAAYQKKAMQRTDIERSAVGEDKDGVFTGKYAINPFNGESVQLWVADYVLAGYGTGAVMAVPAHDTRDFAFAKKYDIPIKVVIRPDDKTMPAADELEDAFTDYGPMVNSDIFDGKSGSEAIDAVTQHAADKGFGRSTVNYKLKDWSVSRQRYWGAPIPIIHCPTCGAVPVNDGDLPVLLPATENFVPEGRSPLADVPEFMKATCPSCGGEAERDPDTMDTYVCSSWYYLRYLDANNPDKLFEPERANAGLPIDLYVGGITHATGHLIYFRFFHKFLRDLGWLDTDEPATKLFNHGMVSDANGEVMSKSKGNVVSPIEVMEKHGVDVARLAMFFTAPSEKEVMWNDKTMLGIEKFVNNRLLPTARQYRSAKPVLKHHFNASDLSEVDRGLYVKLNQTIKKISEDSERLQFNTCIAALMELLRDYANAQVESDQLNDHLITTAIQLAAPMAPHICEELWETIGGESSVFKSTWPEYDRNAIVADTIEIAVQINGKVRGAVLVAQESGQEQVEQAAFDLEKIKAHLDGKKIIKKIYVPGRILNIVAK
ncbi:MAG: leucine--tRNA ligase [bacterium]